MDGNVDAMLWYWPKTGGKETRSPDQIIQDAVDYYEKKYSRPASMVIISNSNTSFLGVAAKGPLPVYSSVAIPSGHLIVANSVEGFDADFKKAISTLDA